MGITTQLQTAKCVELSAMESTGPRLPSGLTCKREDGTRIVGGQDAEPNTWPWMVQLEYGTAFNCGGVIVGENLVLTAGHCCNAWRYTAHLKGRVGNLAKGKGKTIEFKWKKNHPLYNRPNREAENDICMLIPKKTDRI